VIYDSLGHQLVLNKPSFDLILDKKKLPKNASEKERILSEVSNIIEISVQDIKKLIEAEKSNLVLVSEIVDQKKLILVETKISELTGFDVQKNAVRQYVDGPDYAHLVGYTSKASPDDLNNNPGLYSNFDYVGKTGIEKYYEEYLRRNPGKVRVERDVYGNEISKELISPPESGKSLVLYLDSELQKKITEELKKLVADLGIKKAVGVAIDPRNGGVLALVNIPSFDNNLFITGADSKELDNLLKDKEKPLFNQVVDGKFPTGSVIKPIEAIGALEEKLISVNKVLNCEGKIVVPNKYNAEDNYVKNDWMTHGPTDMLKAIAESCDVYFYTIGGGYGNQKGLGPTNLKKYLDLFGWGAKTGIDLPAEVDGFIPSIDWKKNVRKEGWWDGDTYNLSIGQGDIGITPLEVANAFVPIANGGTMYKPQIVREIVDEAKKSIKTFDPEIVKSNFVSQSSLDVAREGMRRAVTAEDAPHASCKSFNDMPVAVAAKTGTAETGKLNTYHNWITLFAPYDNPTIVLTLMVEDTSRLASILPAAKDITNWYFARK
jgi:penicillin-binding protein 2